MFIEYYEMLYLIMPPSQSLPLSTGSTRLLPILLFLGLIPLSVVISRLVTSAPDLFLIPEVSFQLTASFLCPRACSLGRRPNGIFQVGRQLQICSIRS